MTDKQLNILRSVQTMHTLADLMLIEHQFFMIDNKLEIQILAKKAKQITLDAKRIKAELSKIAPPIDSNEVEDHNIQMWRLVKFFSPMDVKQLEQYMDGLEKLPTVEDNEQHATK